jgi:hypothetical protein
MTLNPKSLPKGSTAKRKSTSSRGSDRMTADEEKSVARAYKEVKDDKFRTFKNADEYLKYLDTV